MVISEWFFETFRAASTASVRLSLPKIVLWGLQKILIPSIEMYELPIKY